MLLYITVAVLYPESSEVIVNSNYMKGELERLFGLPYDKINVIKPIIKVGSCELIDIKHATTIIMIKKFFCININLKSLINKPFMIFHL